ncbi:MAG: NAD(P)H-quinone dehydrogenase [Actinomycetales bacterium]|nr:NAD(P)H-quinone dehydrogenase [Actinomycetales bacterium]
MTHVVIIGGGPGGYEAALVASRIGADVTIIERDGWGGSTVLTDCVPSKTLIATSELLTEVATAAELGVELPAHAQADLAAVNSRVLELAQAQSDDIAERLTSAGVTLIRGTARVESPGLVQVSTAEGESRIEASGILIATGASPRTVAQALPDGERVFTWEQIYALDERPEHLIVVGSGVTGAEFASAYSTMGIDVTLISSRDQVLPGEDSDAAALIEDVFTRHGMTVLGNSRMESVVREGDDVVVTLTDGRTIIGSHCLLALGSIPNTQDLGLESVGVRTDESGFVIVDKVSRTSVPGIYAAGDCTGVFMLASVAAQQGRIAMAHVLGDAVNPLNLEVVASNVFTTPEIATVGLTEQQIQDRGFLVDVAMLPLAANARAKMQGIHDGFVKLFARQGVGTIIGGVVVGPHASELIHPVALAVTASLTADQFAETFTVYPSLSGSIGEAARHLHRYS